MFYSTMHSTHFIYGYIRQRIKDHLDSERKPTADTTWAALLNLQHGIIYIHHPIDRIAYTMAFVNVAHAKEYFSTKVIKHITKCSLYKGIFLNKTYLQYQKLACTKEYLHSVISIVSNLLSETKHSVPLQCWDLNSHPSSSFIFFYPL